MEKEFDKKGREVILKIKEKNYTIKFVKQDNLEKNLDGLYQVVANLLYEEALLG